MLSIYIFYKLIVSNNT
ncbi:hypothetical protein ACUOIJ_18110 [Escherichia coli]